MLGASGARSQAGLGVVGTAIGGAVGLNQNIAVVMCTYQNDTTPFLDSTTATIANSGQLAAMMDVALNPHFLAATGGLTSFQFIPVPGICNFTYPNNGNTDDPTIMENELRDAVEFADASTPGIFNTTQRIIVAVNGIKRARAAWATWPFLLPNSGFTNLTVAVVDTTDVAEANFSTVAHELGHELGLPDLYQVDSVPGLLIGRWGQMGQNRNQHFSAYSRQAAGWLPTPQTRVVTFAPGPGETVNTSIRLGPPFNGQGFMELIRLGASAALGASSSVPAVNVGGFLPFVGYYIEARNPVAGAADPDAVLAALTPGVLIFRHSDWLNAETGFSPRPLAIRHPTQTPPPTNDVNATFTAGGPAFSDPAIGLTVTVTAANPDGSFVVNIAWTPPPRPDLIVSDLRLDSPFNGFGTFLDPILFGDPATQTITVTWQDNSPFPPTPVLPAAVTTPPHVLEVSVTNLGGATSGAFTGEVWLLEPTIPVGATFADLSTLAPFRFASIPFTTPAIAPGATAMIPIPVTPAASFLALAILHRGQGETWVDELNNVKLEAFMQIDFLTFASPYEPLAIDLDVENIDGKDRLVAFTTSAPTPMPDGWSISSLNNERMFVPSGQTSRFQMKAEPPPPEVLKPGQLGAVNVTAWMNEGDSFVPVMTLPIRYVLAGRSLLELSAQSDGDKVNLVGRLRRFENGQAGAGIGDETVELSVSGSDGFSQSYRLTTDAQGHFRQSFLRSSQATPYAAIARYQGSEAYGPVDSDPVVIPALTPPLELVDIVATYIRKTVRIAVRLSGPAPQGGLEIQLTSADSSVLPLPPSVRIPAGKTSAVIKAAAKKNLQRYRVTVGASFGRGTLKTEVIRE